jgi:hypothetical protein
MPRAPSPKVVTANDLLDGDVVYLAPGGTWVRDLRHAAPFEEPGEAEAALKAASAQARRIVGAYLMDIRPGPDGPEPHHHREAIRARGPSNYAHGKQADPTDV